MSRELDTKLERLDGLFWELPCKERKVDGEPMRIMSKTRDTFFFEFGAGNLYRDEFGFEEQADDWLHIYPARGRDGFDWCLHFHDNGGGWFFTHIDYAHGRRGYGRYRIFGTEDCKVTTHDIHRFLDALLANPSLPWPDIKN